MSITRTAFLAFVAVWLTASAFAPRSAAQCSLNSNFNGVSLLPGNPFQAEKVTTITPEIQGKLARLPIPPTIITRDNQGRVRIETTAGKYKVDEGQGAGTETTRQVIRICDPVSNKMLLLDTVSKTATIQALTQGALRPRASSTGTFCSTFSQAHNFVATQIQELGHQSIEGFDAVGLRTTREMPSIHNGEATTTPSVAEMWCSEELGALLLQTHQMGSSERKTEMKLTNISRGEPDPSLFQIPPGYRVVERVPEEGRPGLMGIISSGSTTAPPIPVEPPQQ